MKRVLVADGDQRMCQAIQEVLSELPHTVSFAFDAVAAISEALKHNPDLIIVGLSLPAGNGLVVVERLRALAAFIRTPIIVIAEQGARLEAERVLDAGANVFLPKPLRRRQLLVEVSRHLPSQPPQSVWVDATHPIVK